MSAASDGGELERRASEELARREAELAAAADALDAVRAEAAPRLSAAVSEQMALLEMGGAGLEVVDLGVDVSAERFVDTAVSEHCDIIAFSALLTTTMDEMRRVVSLADERGIRGSVKVMIGGAPITQAYCDEIGADCYTADAAQAAQAALRLLA